MAARTSAATAIRRLPARAHLLLAAGLLAGAALAQPVQLPPGSDPAFIQQQEIGREQRRRAEEQRRDRIERPLAPAAAPPAPAPSTADDARFPVREILFQPPSEILPADSLDELAAPYRGRTVRLAELRELVTRINELYRSRGIVTAQASLPAQDVTSGIVRIRLVEGRVGQLRLQGNDSTDADYITDRLTLRLDKLVDLRALERDLVRFNRSNDAQLKADLLPGQALGQTDIALTVVEPKRDDLRIFADNAGSPATGQERVGLAYLRRSLTGRRDDFYASSVKSQGHEGSYISYGVPVSRLGTRLTLGYFHDRIRIVNGPIAPLDVTGRATTASLQLRHPLVVQPRLQLDALASYRQRQATNSISGTVLTETDVQAGQLGLDLQVLDAGGYWTASIEAGGGRETPDIGPPRRFNSARGSIKRSHAWNADVNLLGTLNWQYAPVKLLPSSEQFAIGGEGSVRGYSPGLFAGDRGYALNLEAHRRLPPVAGSSPWALSAFAFWDYGEVQPFRPPNNTRGADTLQSVGGGLSFSYGERASGKIVLGVPVHRVAEELRHYRLHVQLVWHLL